MSYIGIHPQLRAYNTSVYVANEGETKLPLRKDVEAVLVKNGVILTPDSDYYADATNHIVLTSPAVAGDELFLLNLSTFTFSDTVSRSELDKELELRQDPMFSVLWLPSRNVIPAGYVPADGQLEQRSMYPTAWDVIDNAAVPTVTESVWQSDPKKRASYTAGDGSTTFRVPDYNGKSSGGSAAVVLRGDGLNTDPVGSIQGDAIRNIKAEFRTDDGWGFSHTDGAFYQTGIPTSNYCFTSRPGTIPTAPYFKMDVSRVVPTAPENRMVNTAGCWCVRLAHKAVQSGIITASGVVQSVNNHSMQIAEIESKLADVTTDVEKLKLGRWYGNSTNEFQSRFEFINDWTAGKNECLMKETEYEIRFKGIIRRSSPHTNRDMLKIKNPNGDRLVSPYSPMICNAINTSGGFVSIYSEPINTTGDAFFTLSSSGTPSINGWIMIEFTITKNPVIV